MEWIVLQVLFLVQDADPEKLSEQLGDASVEVREAAEALLIELGAGARRALEPLLLSSDPEKQSRAARILKYCDWGITPAEKREIDALIESGRVPSVEDGERQEQGRLDEELSRRWERLGARPTRYLLDLHRAAPQGSRRGHLLSLAARSRSPLALEAAFEDLRSPHPGVRHSAIDACQWIGTAAAVPKLAELLRDQRVLVGLSAAWAIQEIVGFPIDPEQWVERIHPYHLAHHGIVLRLERFVDWWERNRERRTIEEWRDAARAEALARIEPDRLPKDRLSGCMTLVALGGADDRVCRAALDVCRKVPTDDEGFRLRWKALGFLGSDSREYKGRPSERIEEILRQVLSDSKCSPAWPAVLGTAWRLYGGLSGEPLHDGRRFPLIGLRGILRDRLGSLDPGTRCLAGLVLGQMGEPRAEGPLLELLGSALEERARERHPWLEEAATWMLKWSRDEGFELSALAALERVATGKSRDLLWAYARKEEFRLAACRALARLGDAGIVPLLRPHLEAPELERPENDISAWIDSSTREDRRQTAFFCLYQIDRKEALSWWRTRYEGEKRWDFLRGETAHLLVEKSDPLAVELWLARRECYGWIVWERMAQMKPEVLIPALIDHASRGNFGARLQLYRLAPEEGFEWKGVPEMRLWWKGARSAFRTDPAAFSKP